MRDFYQIRKISLGKKGLDVFTSNFKTDSKRQAEVCRCERYTQEHDNSVIEYRNDLRMRGAVYTEVEDEQCGRGYAMRCLGDFGMHIEGDEFYTTVEGDAE